MFHEQTSIQIHTDSALWLSQREQTSRNACCLLSFPSLVQGHKRQRQKLESCVDISWAVKVLAEAFQRLIAWVYCCCARETRTSINTSTLRRGFHASGERVVCAAHF